MSRITNITILLDHAKRHDCTLFADKKSLANKLREIDSILELIDEPLEGKDDPNLAEHWTRLGPEIAYGDSHRTVSVARAIAKGMTSLPALKDVCTREVGIDDMRSNWDEEECGEVDGDPTDFLNSCLELYKALGEAWVIKAYKLWGVIAANWEHDDAQYVYEWELKGIRYDEQRAYEASVVQRYLEAHAA